MSGVDLAPLLGVVAAGLLLALGPFVWFWARQRSQGPAGRLRALALLTLFLSFDLVLLGAYTRLSDSGLGCPDWPGCYGHASPIGAHASIAEAHAAVPTGPVSHGKAWIEMAHRYSASAIGLLIIALVAMAFVAARRGEAGISPWWAVATLVWVCLQGAFGALTVTMGLYPAIVTLHLLGGLGLLALLAFQVERYAPQPMTLTRGLRWGLAAASVLVLLQVALGGWVSTNYAVLACSDFPSCQGSWWPDADFARGFVLRRPLGEDGAGGYLPFQALTAIHLAHRLGAYVVVPALLALAWGLWRQGGAARPWGRALVALVAWQATSGVGNVLLGWPLVAAVAHTAGSAALVVMLTTLIARAWPGRPARMPAWSGGAGVLTS